MHSFPDSESDEDAPTPRHIMYSASQDIDLEMSSSTDVPLPSPVPLPEPDPSFPAPEQYEDLTAEVASFVASLALPCDHNWKTLNSAPFRIISRGPLLTSIVFDDGGSRVMDTAAVDAYIRVTTQMPAPPLQLPPPPQLPPLLQLSPESVVTSTNCAHHLRCSRRPPAPRSPGDPRGNPHALPLRTTNQLHLSHHSRHTRPTGISRTSTMALPRT
jgi:hypothetical protein